ncbi:hypothetical protein AgCh_038834 [Apium graveolens]
MVSYRPRQRSKWLPLAEWWYNFTYHRAIHMSPFEALYRVKPNHMNLPQSLAASIAAVREFQTRRIRIKPSVYGCELVRRSSFPAAGICTGRPVLQRPGRLDMLRHTGVAPRLITGGNTPSFEDSSPKT